MSKEVQKQNEVVEAEFTEVEKEEKEPAVKCQVVVGMTEDGDIYFHVDGTDQSLINIEGLLGYAKRHMDKIWDARLTQQD